jgi:four helix bundle protein
MGKEKGNVIKDKTFSFAVKIVDLYKILLEGKKEYVMSRQILKSGTSIGANVREALNAESSNDFVHKLGIAQKEADETLYWLELLFKSGYINGSALEEYKNDCDEILKVIKSIIISMKRKL